MKGFPHDPKHVQIDISVSEPAILMITGDNLGQEIKLAMMHPSTNGAGEVLTNLLPRTVGE
jgi:hypothetical protein